jgi:putative lipase involved disintegration of autophagic bodies
MDKSSTAWTTPIDLRTKIDKLNCDHITTCRARGIDVFSQEGFCNVHKINYAIKNLAILVQVWLVGRSSTGIVAAMAVIITEFDSNLFAGDSLSM